VPDPFVLVGLGNPGTAYARTRHNVGFDFVDQLARIMSLRWRSPLFRPAVIARSPALVLVKPRTYMNRSGAILPHLVSRFRCTVESLCVVVDNMDLPPGEIRMKRRGGSSGHNGLKSISNAIGSDDFSRIYIGIGRPSSGESTVDHVLGVFDPEDRNRIDAAIERVAPVFLEETGASLERWISMVNDRRRPPGTAESP
jgi:peptidyl-tRNA hydrolase, PTH1 family